jgi:hypothetical protein
MNLDMIMDFETSMLLFKDIMIIDMIMDFEIFVDNTCKHIISFGVIYIIRVSFISRVIRSRHIFDGEVLDLKFKSS